MSNGYPHSPIFRFAASEYHECRAEFEHYRQAGYNLAEEMLAGALLNPRGKAAGIDPYSLFMGSWIRAKAYASEELLEHWTRHRRMSFHQYELQRTNGREQAA